ncbi:uncharacterized protein FFMR_05481 [Fusarium fujikuroi]|nr:uncharacterized protein FFMR_05481 [Fusarium fujikuroi]
MAETGANHVLPNLHGAQISQILMTDPLNLNDLGFNRYPTLPLGDLPAARVREIYEKIVDEIFSAMSMTRQASPQCWDQCVASLESENVLLATIFTECEAYRTIKDKCMEALNLPRIDEQTPCLPAPVLVSLIATINYRKVSVAKPHNSIIAMLGDHDTAAWLKVAIQVFGTTGQNPFLVSRDDSVHSPTTDQSNGVWTIKATMPLPHRYLALVHRELPRLRAAPELRSDSVKEDESLEEALRRLNRRLVRDIGDAVYTEAPAQFHTITLRITREQALARVGELVRQVRNADFDQEQLKPQMERSIDFHIFSVLPLAVKKKVHSWYRNHSPESNELIQRFASVLLEDITETSWEHKLQGERINMKDSDLAAPSMKLLAKLINSLPKTGGYKLVRGRGIQAFNDIKNIIDYQRSFRDHYTKLMEATQQNRYPNSSLISDEALEQLKETQEQLKNTQEQLKNTQEQLKNTQEQLKGTQEQLKGTQEQLEGTLVYAATDNFESQEYASQEMFDAVQAVYLRFRRDGLVIPCEIHTLAALSLSEDQHRDVMNASPDEEMLDA